MQGYDKVFILMLASIPIQHVDKARKRCKNKKCVEYEVKVVSYIPIRQAQLPQLISKLGVDGPDDSFSSSFSPRRNPRRRRHLLHQQPEWWVQTCLF